MERRAAHTVYATTPKITSLKTFCESELPRRKPEAHLQKRGYHKTMNAVQTQTTPRDKNAENRALRFAQMQPGNHASDGRFLFGVRTTGIYCLPSCHARRAKEENVVFFDSETEAVQSGLRACRKCRPDRFYQNHDPDKDALQSAAQAVLANPEKFADVADIASIAGMGATKCFALFRQHYQTTPTPFLKQARVRAACDLFEADARAGVPETAFAVGAKSVSAFHDTFRAETGMAPAQFRDFLHTISADMPAFALSIPPLAWTTARAIHCRDAHSLTETATADGFVKAFLHKEQPLALHFSYDEPSEIVTCRVSSSGPQTPALRRAAHRVALRLLGLMGNPAEIGAWESKAETEPLFARLIGNRKGLRVPLASSVWESVAWAIIGQQINLPFAYSLRRALTQIAPIHGTVDGLTPFPSAQSVAGLDYADLTARQFSRRKAEYVIDTARRVVSGELNLATLAFGGATPFGDAEKTLLAVRGLGPWSAHYILMRGANWPDCVPVGDTGITAGLRNLYALDHGPAKEETLRLMEPFAPLRSLATHHLWASLGGEIG